MPCVRIIMCAFAPALPARADAPSISRPMAATNSASLANLWHEGEGNIDVRQRNEFKVFGRLEDSPVASRVDCAKLLLEDSRARVI